MSSSSRAIIPPSTRTSTTNKNESIHKHVTMLLFDGSHTPPNVSIISYILGLVTTFGVSHSFFQDKYNPLGVTIGVVSISCVLEYI